MEGRWFDPRQEQFGKVFHVAGGKKTEFAAPDENDWELCLEGSPRR
jgi:hypothetical protein